MEFDLKSSRSSKLSQNPEKSLREYQRQPSSYSSTSYNIDTKADAKGERQSYNQNLLNQTHCVKDARPRIPSCVHLLYTNINARSNTCAISSPHFMKIGRADLIATVVAKSKQNGIGDGEY